MFDDLYQEIILDHYKNPRNKTDLSSLNIPYLENPVCGDSVKVALDWKDGRIEKARFEGSGCAISTASASMMTDLVFNKTQEEAEDAIKRFIAVMQGKEEGTFEEWGEIESLNGVKKFPARVKCATLPWHALEEAIRRDR